MENKHQTKRIKEMTERINSFCSKIEDGAMKLNQVDIDLLKTYVIDLYDYMVSLKPGKISNGMETSKEVVTANLAEEVITAENTEKPPANEEKVDEIGPEPIVEEAEVETPESSEQMKEDLFSKISADDDSPAIHEKFKQESPELADQLEHSSIADLKNAIGVNERVAFIDNLFGGDSGAFDEAMSTLNEIKDIVEANQYINSNLKDKFNWEEEDKMVDEFSKLVERRFV